MAHVIAVKCGQDLGGQDAKARCFALTGSETGSLPRFGVLIVCDAGGTNKYAGTEHLGQRWDMLDINAGQA